MAIPPQIGTAQYLSRRCTDSTNTVQNISMNSSLLMIPAPGSCSLRQNLPPPRYRPLQMKRDPASPTPGQIRIALPTTIAKEILITQHMPTSKVTHTGRHTTAPGHNHKPDTMVRPLLHSNPLTKESETTAGNPDQLNHHCQTTSNPSPDPSWQWQQTPAQAGQTNISMTWTPGHRRLTS